MRVTVLSGPNPAGLASSPLTASGNATRSSAPPFRTRSGKTSSLSLARLTGDPGNGIIQHTPTCPQGIDIWMRRYHRGSTSVPVRNASHPALSRAVRRMMVDKVLLAEPRGFCAGVEMAIKALTWMVNMFEPPVYCYHEIVHNRWVVDAFERSGVVFVESIDEVPAGAPVMLSAHGSAPEIVTAADDRAGLVIDSVCPLVTKVHHEVKKMAERGFDIIYVGHEGHDEAVGTVAEAPDAITLVEPETGLDGFAPSDPTKVALLAQTTLGMHEWQQVLISAQNEFPDLTTARKSDLCYATTNRQDAVREMAEICDVILVVGSVNSSNTQALVRTAETAGTPAYRVDSAEAVDPAWLGSATTVGVTAGASAPDHLVQEVIDRVAPAGGVELFQTVTEGEYFPLPRQLRGFVTALEHAVVGGMHARPTGDEGPLVRDREWTATEALQVLTDR